MMHRALRQCRVPSDLLVYKDQGYVISRPRLIAKCLESNLAWLERWLR